MKVTHTPKLERSHAEVSPPDETVLVPAPRGCNVIFCALTQSLLIRRTQRTHGVGHVTPQPSVQRVLDRVVLGLPRGWSHQCPSFAFHSAICFAMIYRDFHCIGRVSKACPRPLARVAAHVIAGFKCGSPACIILYNHVGDDGFPRAPGPPLGSSI
jgi:hypothetical protein